jgi:hypothetical protein
MVDRDAIYRAIDNFDKWASWRQVPKWAPKIFHNPANGHFDLTFNAKGGEQFCLDLTFENLADFLGYVGMAMEDRRKWMLNWQRRAEQLDEPPVP